MSDEQVATVTASPKPGFTFTGAELGTGWTLNDDGTATWSRQLESTVCDSQGVLTQPKVTAPECTPETAGKTLLPSVAAPENTDGISYGEVVVDDEGNASVTAKANAGFVLSDVKLDDGWTTSEDGTATWSQELDSVTCEAAPVVTPPDPEPTTPGSKPNTGPGSPHGPKPGTPHTGYSLVATGGAPAAGLATAAIALAGLGLLTALAARRKRAQR